MPNNLIRVPRSTDNLTPRERRIYDMLPPEGQRLYLSTLPPLYIDRQTARDKARNLRILEQRIQLLTRIARACESKADDLRRLWNQVQDNQPIDLRQALAPPNLPEA